MWVNRAKREISPTGFVLLVCLANLVIYNFPLAHYVMRESGGFSADALQTLAALAALVVVITSAILFVGFLLSAKLVKPLLMILALSNSVALYFMLTYQVILDKSMMGNVQNTNLAEARELFHPELLVYVGLLGIVPAWFITRVHFKPVKRSRLVGHAMGIALLGMAAVYSASSSWLWVDKHAKVLGGMVLPWSYVFNTARYLGAVARAGETRALLPDVSGFSADRDVVVLVLGEAARARDFSLYGYPRDTNPELRREGALALPDTRSCATYTTAALECILGDVHHRGLFSGSYEVLPSYLHRNGVDVIWRSNNWGEPPLNVDEYLRADDLKPGCQGDECDYDGVLLTGLEDRIRSSQKRKLLVVLHTKGSHGPLYKDRYPEAFQRFTPVCASVDLQRCPPDGLLNAYDNSILYTDHLLASVISLLKGLRDRNSVLIYLSDHGESLGEHGLYLHGTPYTVAPDVQKQIPFILWMSPAFQRRHPGGQHVGLHPPYSQDNVFHSVLGALGVRSPVYDPELDVFALGAETAVAGPGIEMP